MKTTPNNVFQVICACWVVAAIAALPILLTQPTMAHGYEHASLKIKHPWTRVTPPGAKVAGGFLKITNNGKESDKLLGGSFSLSKRVEVHEMSMNDGVMRMKQLEAGLEIAPGQTVELKPGSFHLMFMGLSASPKLEERVRGMLKFEKAGELEVEFAVAPIGASSHSDKQGSHDAGDEHGGHHMKH